MKPKPSARKNDLVSRIGEFGLIERILSKFAIRDKRSVLVGPGDDAAVIACGEGLRLVLTTDMLVEGTHFRLEWSCPEAVGFKAVTANMSDVAAMGGAPVGIVVSLGIPASIPTRAVDMLYRGISGALSKLGGEMLGGDTVRSERITVSVAAIGTLAGERPLLRRGARAGDEVCVTGSLGRAEMGLLLLERFAGRKDKSRGSAMRAWAARRITDLKGRIPSSVRGDGYACLRKHLIPEPRMRDAVLLARQGKNAPSAMMDVSDGLSSDLRQIAVASAVGMRVYEDRIPIHPSAAGVAGYLGVSAARAALSSGEEYELLFTVAPSRLRDLMRAMSRADAAPLTVIGEVTGSVAGLRPGTVSLVSAGGRRSELTHRGFRHF
ncbi:MAG: thiamine-phosphate kinase [Candidatus Eisenbacteria bacterium]|nr:thiamine-phosphate kinase [Candidatus Eisenbacteria bacterium]